MQFVERLNQVHRNLFSTSTLITRILRSGNLSTYVYGLPGGGKTYIANIYLHFLKKKKLGHLVLRVHFQEFMSMIHTQVGSLRLKKVSNPLDIIGKRLSKKYKLICFDELEIVDIADAMIVSKLFTSLLKKDISFIITSNFEPSQLYKFGLQREQFLPFIEIIKNKMSIINVKNNADLRKNTSGKKSYYFFYPLNNVSKKKYLQVLGKTKKATSFKSKIIYSLGRKLIFEKTMENNLITDFNFLCSYNFSPNDYIAISNVFDFYFIDNIPELNNSKINEARRFIILIDILYEKKSKIIIRSEKKPENIFTLKKNKDLPFLRTVSRITEMTTQKWFKF